MTNINLRFWPTTETCDRTHTDLFMLEGQIDASQLAFPRNDDLFLVDFLCIYRPLPVAHSFARIANKIPEKHSHFFSRYQSIWIMNEIHILCSSICLKICKFLLCMIGSARLRCRAVHLPEPGKMKELNRTCSENEHAVCKNEKRWPNFQKHKGF